MDYVEDNRLTLGDMRSWKRRDDFYSLILDFEHYTTSNFIEKFIQVYEESITFEYNTEDAFEIMSEMDFNPTNVRTFAVIVDLIKLRTETYLANSVVDEKTSFGIISEREFKLIIKNLRAVLIRADIVKAPDGYV